MKRIALILRTLLKCHETKETIYTYLIIHNQSFFSAVCMDVFTIYCLKKDFSSDNYMLYISLDFMKTPGILENTETRTLPWSRERKTNKSGVSTSTHQVYWTRVSDAVFPIRFFLTPLASIKKKATSVTPTVLLAVIFQSTIIRKGILKNLFLTPNVLHVRFRNLLGYTMKSTVNLENIVSYSGLLYLIT